MHQTEIESTGHAGGKPVDRRRQAQANTPTACRACNRSRRKESVMNPITTYIERDRSSSGLRFNVRLQDEAQGKEVKNSL